MSFGRVVMYHRKHFPYLWILYNFSSHLAIVPLAKLNLNKFLEPVAIVSLVAASVCFPSSTQSDGAHETGFTIPDQEPEELCEKISWLLNDPQLHATMSQRAVEYAQGYAWEKIAKQIVEVYDGLVKK